MLCTRVFRINPHKLTLYPYTVLDVLNIAPFRGANIYIIPIIGALWFGLRDMIRAQSNAAEYRTSIDVKNHTVAAVDWSLPSETRLKLR